jgi:hypothetical protein
MPPTTTTNDVASPGAATDATPETAAAADASAVAEAPKRLARVLTNLHHGGHAIGGETPPAARGAALDGTAIEEVVPDAAAAQPVEDISTPFGYLFDGLKTSYPDGHLPVEPASTVVAGLKALGSAMVDAPPDGAPNSSIPPVYTYFGQFVDHDITANTDREKVIDIAGEPLTPIEPGFVLGLLHNLREPALNLDSVYGNGPGRPDVDDEVPYDGIKLRTGNLQVLGLPIFTAVPGGDLPRVAANGKARIGDSRNDENLIVAQLHLAFLNFHNKVVDWVIANEPGVTTDDARFARAQELTRWHYQAIVVEDFLRRVALSSVVDDVLAAGGNPVIGADGRVFMPLEHSVAAYRFGHSMVRAAYDHNENFGRQLDGAERPTPIRATFEQEFQFTGNNVIKGAGADPDEFEFTTLPDNWPIRWTRFTDGDQPDRFARKIDTHLAPPLKDLTNEGKDENGVDLVDVRVRRILKRRAVRNLLRGYRLAIPTGQAVAGAAGVTPLTEAQLLQGDQGVADALVDGGFLDNTPLWFYVLKEAEVTQGGERLGEVGSHIVCTTLIGQIKADPGSYLNKTGGPWSPADGVKLPGDREITTVRDFLEFAGVLI